MDYPLPNFSVDLTGQVAVVTGASSGLGERFAKVLAAAGASVALCGRRQERLEAVAQTIKASGGRAIPVVVDVQNADQLLQAAETTQRELGLPTILINNAGMPDAQRAHKMSVGFIDQVIATNLRGPYILACEFARRLIAAKQPGRIVNIASMAAFRYHVEGSALYVTTKGALVRMTEALAVEWARVNINVNCIAPGAFHSDMTRGMISRVGDLTAGFPRGRIGDAEQMDSTLLYLVSPSSDFVTGTVIKIDDAQVGR